MTDVKVYTTSTCPWCNVVKDFLKDNNVAFQEINVGTDQKAAMDMVAKSGQMGVPQVEIDGAMIVGFNEQAIRQALGL